MGADVVDGTGPVTPGVTLRRVGGTDPRFMVTEPRRGKMTDRVDPDAARTYRQLQEGV